ncbi:trypsin-like serine protease [uncultured Ruegeria sp.]|uniref:trypsin-like serine protease n=1 Tax=uncultured Ruegeria sp. TaxID=259304 RepID=UPI002617915D|nr:trypsin-like serine protease [uncultured Ruegeria sp.]
MADQQTADFVLSSFEDALFENPNVTYAAVIEKGKGDYVIEVSVLSIAANDEAKARFSSFSSDEEEDALPFVPERLSVPSRFTSQSGTDEEDEQFVDISIIESPEITAQNLPAQGGDSIGNFRYRNAGTLGAVVTISTLPGKQFIITNWHVLVGNGATRGDRVLHPGVLDGGTNPGGWLANLTWSRISDRVDLAIAELRRPYSRYGKLGQTSCFGGISGSNYAPAVGSAAKKCGRTSGNTSGTVRSTNATVRVGYPSGTRTFRNQILLTDMSRPGDSGSLVLDNGNKVIGLLFAGNSQDTTIANRISDVEAALGSASAIAANPEKLPEIVYS